MVKCQNCGNEVGEAKFCSNCGCEVERNVADNFSLNRTQKSKFCPECGSEVNGSAAHCSNCGCELTPKRDSNQVNNSTAQQSKFCHICGNEVNYAAAVCPSCGADVGNEGNASLNEMAGGNFIGIVKFAIISTIGILITGSALYFLIGFWCFFVMFIIISFFGSVLFGETKEAAIYGGIIGIIVGLLQNHILSFMSGFSLKFVDYWMGIPISGFILSGIILGVIGNAFFKKTSIGKQVEEILSPYRVLFL